jgi:hypothetical protein
VIERAAEHLNDATFAILKNDANVIDGDGEVSVYRGTNIGNSAPDVGCIDGAERAERSAVKEFQPFGDRADEQLVFVERYRTGHTGAYHFGGSFHEFAGTISFQSMEFTGRVVAEVGIIIQHEDVIDGTESAVELDLFARAPGKDGVTATVPEPAVGG